MSTSVFLPWSLGWMSMWPERDTYLDMLLNHAILWRTFTDADVLLSGAHQEVRELLNLPPTKELFVVFRQAPQKKMSQDCTTDIWACRMGGYALTPGLLSTLVDSVGQVKLAGMAGVRVEELTSHRSVVKVANVRRVSFAATTAVTADSDCMMLLSWQTRCWFQNRASDLSSCLNFPIVFRSLLRGKLDG